MKGLEGGTLMLQVFVGDLELGLVVISVVRRLAQTSTSC